MATSSRKQRGSATENLYAEYVRSRGWPYAEATKAQGRDTTGMPGLAPEIKARRGFDPLAWLRQAARNAGGDLAYVVWRPDGMGPQSIDDWGVMLRNGNFTELLHQAGYGTPNVQTAQNFSGKFGGVNAEGNQVFYMPDGTVVPLLEPVGYYPLRGGG